MHNWYTEQEARKKLREIMQERLTQPQGFSWRMWAGELGVSHADLYQACTNPQRNIPPSVQAALGLRVLPLVQVQACEECGEVHPIAPYLHHRKQSENPRVQVQTGLKRVHLEEILRRRGETVNRKNLRRLREELSFAVGFEAWAWYRRQTA